MNIREKANKIASHFIWRKFVSRLFTKIFWMPRAKRVARHILSQIPEGAQVLDIGAGNGLVAKEIAEKRNANITLLDVIDWNTSKFPVKMFDGENIPFKDKEFDVALLVDVVHHSNNEEQLVKEALRVAKKVVVLEEKHENKGMSLFANLTDNLQFILYGMPLGAHHRNSKEWLKFFQGFSPKANIAGEYHQHVIVTI